MDLTKGEIKEELVNHKDELIMKMYVTATYNFFHDLQSIECFIHITMQYV